ncbi:hypothetical protein HPULCUR_006071 [Helicostylum pulchrum]|uniref:Uncharacterized protein n=1 Tax=Helicostylum pulchrum TaxID=562976 RepID=A0ABP9Y1Q5_9FUNG
MAQHSSEIKYRMVNINGNNVSIPYVRLATGGWVPLQQQSYYVQQELQQQRQQEQRQQQQQLKQQQQWNTQRTLPLETFVNPSHINPGRHVNPALNASRTMYPSTNL